MNLGEFEPTGDGPSKGYFIYEIDGDALKICCFGNSDHPGQRPTAFTTAEKPEVFVSHWKRVRMKR